ncbi:hypothetical protein [Streptomyces caniscabiei]|nr:hypothetical protein [Streptomyces caniscabiei]
MNGDGNQLPARRLLNNAVDPRQLPRLPSAASSIAFSSRIERS